MSQKTQNQPKGNLAWWQLSLIGIGCTIGTGFFLGSSIAITKSGVSVLLSFLIAGLGTFFVFEQLAKLSAKHPEKGSFCAYARNAFGKWAGFSNGWLYWSSEMLITGSQLTAISLFTKHWFPNVPLWVFASIYAVLGLLVIFTGLSTFEKTENILAIVKTAAIFMFIVIAILALCGVLSGGRPDVQIPNETKEFFPFGAMGLWTGLIYAFYAFGGIEVMGLMAVHLKKPEEASKSGKLMLASLAIIYVISIGLALLLVPLQHFSEQDSPFITSLKGYNLDVILDIFNGIFIIAGFSTLVASLFAVTTLLCTMADDGDAPKCFTLKENKKICWPALGLTFAGLILSIVLSLVLPKNIYEHMTTAAGLMLLYTWMFILFSSKKLTKPSGMGKMQIFCAMFLIAAAVSGTLFEKSSRPGFFVSLGFLAIIAIVTWIVQKKAGGTKQPC
ncbi:amino acid permease family protein [Bacillus atrophaeus subsp. globigii]|uniref:Amino acid transporter n=1 Tax=Bacillus atrophaeus (strain 1942) TaxID=720555 RepID=A0ABN3ZFV7_BACA1|nr:amino acid permease [Bacillus atrophaeus]AMR64196.1 transporter [Bacillus subtilis subsp. globigii]ADP34954.1 putative amino acid transporter [Bacillus atrophaeus 1942]AIK48886.1 amino acid permease family protein [Bacillus atrophaeus subsp. globigii]ASS69799.1 amino acid permease [Bacillus atrophaeus]KFK81104.1 amino acid permease family protein [Bacillus atrophaeus]